MSPIDFESFKESGAIEYTADVVWGLQLSILSSESFKKLKSTDDKRQALLSAKGATPRKIDLIVLKNRYGTLGNSFSFLYYPEHDIFVPVGYPIITTSTRQTVNDTAQNVPDTLDDAKAKLMGDNLRAS